MPLPQRYLAATLGALELHLRRYALEWGIALLAAVGVVGGAYLLLGAPLPYPVGQVIVIGRGSTGRSVAEELGAAGLVRYPLALELYWRVRGEGSHLQPGTYRFAAPQNAITIARRLAAGRYGIPSVRIIFPEGTTVLDMASKIGKALPGVSTSDFIAAAGPYEGYLFPDTYTFQPSDTAATIVARMQKNFADKTAPLASDIATSGHSLSDIIILASIVEREAARSADRAMVAGIMWNRIGRGIPLQVDAVFGYIYSRGTYSPSFRDLGVDSPYNTYNHKGLPPGAISNPGLSSIEAALHPAKTKYLFYLTGRDGLMHYATTYQGHKANLATYLR